MIGETSEKCECVMETFLSMGIREFAEYSSMKAEDIVDFCSSPPMYVSGKSRRGKMNLPRATESALDLLDEASFIGLESLY